MSSTESRPVNFGIVKEIPGEPVPHSNVRAETDYWAETGDPALIIRCDDCGYRLYDARPRVVFMGEGVIGVYCYNLQRKCPKCKVLNNRDITCHDGQAVGEDGRWLCNCGAFLAQVQAPRGRVKVPCRCHRAAVVTIPRAIQVVRESIEDIPF